MIGVRGRVTSLKALMLGALACALAACQTTRPTQLPAGSEAYAVVPPADPAAPPLARTLRSGDEIAVQVYREPDLSAARLTIDDEGLVQLPLIGTVEAGGTTPASLSERIRERYAARYLRDPKVTVALLARIAPTVAIEGQVTSPGVFAITRTETLLSTLARAGSTTRVARNDEVVVFRTAGGQRMGARFNLDEIRAGRAPDPHIVDGDVVVVGFSAVKGAYRDFLLIAPLLNLFTVF